MRTGISTPPGHRRRGAVNSFSSIDSLNASPRAHWQDDDKLMSLPTEWTVAGQGLWYHVLYVGRWQAAGTRHHPQKGSWLKTKFHTRKLFFFCCPPPCSNVNVIERLRHPRPGLVGATIVEWKDSACETRDRQTRPSTSPSPTPLFFSFFFWN